MGPRGRNVSTSRSVTAMGYLGDDHSFTRGPGAIAALDAASPRRRVARARQLQGDARRDAARARTTMGAIPLVPVLAKGVASGVAHAVAARTLMPGQRLTPVSPGTVQMAKYPGLRGYKAQPVVSPTPYGGKINPVFRAPTLPHVRGGSIISGGAMAPVLGTQGTGTLSPGAIGLPTAGNVNPVTGQVDPTSSGGGGGGGDSSGGGDATLPDGTNAADGGTDTTTQSTDPNAGGGALVTPSPTDVTAPDTSTTATSTTTRNWLIAGAVLLGGYWLLKKH